MQCIILFKVDINCVRDVVCQRRLKSITQSKFVKQICSHIILKYYLLVSSYIKWKNSSGVVILVSLSLPVFFYFVFSSLGCVLCLSEVSGYYGDWAIMKWWTSLFPGSCQYVPAPTQTSHTMCCRRKQEGSGVDTIGGSRDSEKKGSNIIAKQRLQIFILKCRQSDNS